MMLVPDHYDKGIAGYLHHYQTMFHLCSNAFEGIPELLAVLQNKQVRMALVTGKGRHSTAISLRQFGLAGYFERIETGSPAGARKAEGIQMLNAWPGITKQEVIYVGDAPGDISASRQAGIPVIAAAWAETAEPEKLLPLQPDGLFYSVDAFAEWLFEKVD